MYPADNWHTSEGIQAPYGVIQIHAQSHYTIYYFSMIRRNDSNGVLCPNIIGFDNVEIEGVSTTDMVFMIDCYSALQDVLQQTQHENRIKESRTKVTFGDAGDAALEDVDSPRWVRSCENFSPHSLSSKLFLMTTALPAVTSRQQSSYEIQITSVIDFHYVIVSL